MLLKALRLESITQPVAACGVRETPKGNKKTVVNNPFWDTAPRGAYGKGKRLSGLIHFLATSYRGGNVVHLLDRLATMVWRVSIRHLNGMIRAIRAIVARAPRLGARPQRPEALAGFEALTSTPNPRVRVYPFTRNGRCRLPGCVAMRQSTCVETVRKALWCTKCTGPQVRARWFSPLRG